MILSNHAISRYILRTGLTSSLEDAVVELRSKLEASAFCSSEEAQALIKSSRLQTVKKGVKYKAWFDDRINEWCVAVIYKNVVRTILTEVIYSKGISRKERERR